MECSEGPTFDLEYDDGDFHVNLELGSALGPRWEKVINDLYEYKFTITLYTNQLNYDPLTILDYTKVKTDTSQTDPACPCFGNVDGWYRCEHGECPKEYNQDFNCPTKYPWDEDLRKEIVEDGEQTGSKCSAAEDIFFYTIGDHSYCRPGTTISSSLCNLDIHYNCNWKAFCGEPKPDITATIGAHPGTVQNIAIAGNVPGENSEAWGNVNWCPLVFYGDANNYQGVIRATYYWDWSSYNYLSNGKNFITAVERLGDETVTDMNPATTEAGPIPDNGLILRMARIFAICFTFYNEIYDPTSTFRTTDFISVTGSFTLFKTSVLQNAGGSSTLDYFYEDLMKMPEITQDGDDFYITLYVNRNTYVEEVSPTDLLNGLFRDDDPSAYIQDASGKVFSPNTITVELDETTCFYTKLSEDDTIYSIDPDEVKNLEIPCVNSLLLPSQEELDETMYPFVTYYSYKCKISEWSPLLYIYAMNYDSELIWSETTCTKILNQTKLKPFKCFDCPSPQTFTDPCIEDIEQYCPMKYYPPEYIVGSYVYISDYFLVSEAQQCLCYAKNVGTSGLGNDNRHANMCFSTYCSAPNWVNAFNLENENCIDECKIMWDSLQNLDVTPAFLDRFNTDKYNTVCGANYTAYKQNTFNWQLFLGLLIFSAAISTCVAFTVKKKRIAATSGIAAILIAISIFISIDLAGQYTCKNDSRPTTSLCKSKITNVALPKTFCSTMLQCECAVDNDCPTYCSCASGLCLGAGRTFTTKNCKSMNYNNLIPLTACAIGLPPTLMLISKYYHLPYHIYVPAAIIVATIFTIPAALTGIIRTENNSLTGDCLPSSST